MPALPQDRAQQAVTNLLCDVHGGDLCDILLDHRRGVRDHKLPEAEPGGRQRAASAVHPLGSAVQPLGGATLWETCSGVAAALLATVVGRHPLGHRHVE